MALAFGTIDGDGFVKLDYIQPVAIHSNPPLRVTLGCRCGVKGFNSRLALTMHKNTDCTYWAFVRESGHHFKEPGYTPAKPLGVVTASSDPTPPLEEKYDSMRAKTDSPLRMIE